MATSVLFPKLSARAPLAPLVLYSYLQALDLLTTIAFLLGGVKEGNPLVVWAMGAAPHPLAGLVGVKLAAMALGLFCWTTLRLRLLRKVNVFFAVLVAWNLACLILGLGAK